MWLFLLVFPLQSVLSDEIFTSSYSITDQCINICKEDTLPLLDLENYEQIVCQRGCRFFNIIIFKSELNINTTKRECYLSCNESYVMNKENYICLRGCDLMAKKRQTQSDMSTFLVLAEGDDSNNIVLAEPDLEILESDILSDPNIKNQLEIGFNIDYKIPETHIRTMPIEFNNGGTKNSEYKGDWLDCASRNSGIPRWILLTAFLSAVLVALWLSFSTEKRANEEVVDMDLTDDKLILEHEEKDPQLEFLSPPKYTLETEKV